MPGYNIHSRPLPKKLYLLEASLVLPPSEMTFGNSSRGGGIFFRLTDDVALLGMISVAHKRRRAEAATCSIHAPWNISFVWRTGLEEIGWGCVIVCVYNSANLPYIINSLWMEGSPNLTLNLPKSIDGFRDGRRCGVQLCMNMLFPLGRTWLVKQCGRRIQSREKLS